MTETSLAPPLHPPNIGSQDALFLDVDGCLLPFAPSPERVRVPNTLLGILSRLTRQLDGALALVSGRSLASLDVLFGQLDCHRAGVHGNEMGDGDQSYDEVSAILGRIAKQADLIAARHPGALVENKRIALAMHWRAAPKAERALQMLAERSVAELSGYRILQGAEVVELLPAGRDKGDAVAAFMSSEPFASRRPIFLGDDTTDEPGFREVKRRGGHGISVGPRCSVDARYRLATPEAVLKWLGEQSHALQGRVTS